MHHIHIHREKPWSQLMQRGQFKNFKIFSWFKKKKKKTWEITLQGNYHHKVKVPDGPEVKNLPAKHEMQETEVWSLDQEDPLEEEISTYSTILDREPHGQKSLVGYSAKGHEELDTTEYTQTSKTHSQHHSQWWRLKMFPLRLGNTWEC